VIVVSEHIEPMPSEDGQLTETFKGNKYISTNSIILGGVNNYSII
jgi:hypothetical protein